MKKIEKSIELGGRTLTLSTGDIAEQASGAVMARYGDTVVLATVVAAPLLQDPGYFPLTVEYQERLYAGGRIKGSRWVKREGRPSDDEILTGRLIDRSIRPLFPKIYKKDVQVILTVLSVDMENTPDVAAAVATSAAIAISSIPWQGPTGTVRVGFKDGAYFTNPLDSEQKFSDLDLIVSSTKDAVIMVEAGAKQVSEEAILGAIEYAQTENAKLIGLINDLVGAVGREKEVVTEDKIDAQLITRIKKLVDKKLEDVINSMAKNEGRSLEFQDLTAAVMDAVGEDEKKFVPAILDKFKAEYIRNLALRGKRVDGRKLTEIRPLSAAVGVLPRTHGSAIFQRGQTQVLTVTTLGAPSLEQLIETAVGEESKRYIHHYSFPPYSVGETGRVGAPNRREIGHGALAERALEPVIPTEEVFPYTVRVVSEVLSSNGSTSMASVCGSTLSLMDAGVPLSSPVAGIAMGIILQDTKTYAILTDIMGLEDFNGDMDFKVAGTKDGVTALQLDVKALNLTPKILKEALDQAKEARLAILKVVSETLPGPRTQVSNYAPKIKVVKVDPAKIGEVIGPGGKTIRKIIADTGAQVEVEDDGSVNISAMTEEALAAAVATVEGLTKEVAAGEIYEGEVKRIQPFGAFVQILPGKDGLVHVSDMGEGFVSDPNDVVKIGDKVKVRVREIDELGRINLSMRMDPATDKPKTERRGDRGERPGFGGSRRDFGGSRPSFGGRGFDRRGGRGGFGRRDDRGGGRFSRDRRSDDRGDRSGGPHFPASRLMERKDFGR